LHHRVVGGEAAGDVLLAQAVDAHRLGRNGPARLDQELEALARHDAIADDRHGADRDDLVAAHVQSCAHVLPGAHDVDAVGRWYRGHEREILPGPGMYSALDGAIEVLLVPHEAVIA
jgi:hypothetical protein